MPEIVTRAEAKARGLKRYFTGKPCKRGHIDERSTKYVDCYQCGLEKTRKWQSSHREEHLNGVKKYNLANPEKRKDYGRAYNIANREKIKMYRRMNPEKHKMANKKYYDANREKCRLLTAKWRVENPDKYAEQLRKYRSKVSDLIAVLRKEMPELLKEFGL